MKAFLIAWRAIAGVYGDLFFLIGMSLLWWVTGGIFVAAAVAVALSMFVNGGPWWLAPVIAIPAGPAMLALAEVCRRLVRVQPVDRLDYLDTLKRYWKQGLAMSAISMVVLALTLLNALFYLQQTNAVLKILSAAWIYLVIFWLGMQLFLYSFFVALEKPRIVHCFKMAALAALANPLYAALLLLITLALTALCIALPILLVLVWPALMAMMGEHGLRLLIQRGSAESTSAENGDKPSA
jgi:uncharacterized membrane protein YesL